MSFPRRLVLALRVCVPLFVASPSALADEALEHERLAALVRQLDLVDRLAEGAQEAAREAETRYRFDYVRLHDDVERVRAGIRDYLTPPCAQPRDLAPLSGEYRIPRLDPKESP
jgi:RAQPRD family integrative conjugative element protein